MHLGICNLSWNYIHFKSKIEYQTHVCGAANAGAGILM